MTLYNDQDPNDIIGFENYDQYDDVLPAKTAKAAKSAKPGKNGKEASSKVKKAVLPVVSQYEGWMIAVLDKLQPGETPSWSKSRKTLLPFSTQELHDLATDHEKRNGSLSHQFQKLCPNQQQIVTRMVAEKNAEEQQTNAEWILSCVKRLHTEQRTAFRTYKINNGMQVIMLRQEKPKEVAEPIKQKVEDENIIDLTKPVKLPKKEASPKAGKDGEKKVKGDKKKVSKKEQPAQENYDESWPEYMGESNFQQNHQQQDQYQQHQHQQQPDPYQQQHDNFQQHHQQQQQQPYQQQEQPPYVDPYHMHEMSGALPNDDGRIPIPAHEFPPEAPMAPQYSHQQPFQPFAGVPQADLMNDARRHDPSAFNPPHFSARRGSRSRTRQEPEREPGRDSHSRPRQEPEREPRRDSHSRPRREPERETRRDSVDSDKIRRKEVRKIGEILKTELRDEVRGEIRDALREAAAEDKVRRWPVGGMSSYPPTTISGQSSRQDDMWSSPPSSDGRRYSYSTPGTSPDRGERYYQSPRPTGSLHRQDSSGYDSHHRQDGRRYYQDRDHVLRPHDSQRERHRDYDRGRSPKYIRERKEVVDDYPDAQYHRQQQQQPRREPRVYMEERPRVQRRVTDFPGALPTADHVRRPRNDIDFTDQRVYGDNRERRGGRERQPVYHHR
jgi:hypothetical protein